MQGGKEASTMGEGRAMRAQSAEEQVQGVRRGQHLPAQLDKEQVQDVYSRQGRVHAAGSRGALTEAHQHFLLPWHKHLVHQAPVLSPPLGFSDLGIDTQKSKYLARMALSKI